MHASLPSLFAIRAIVSALALGAGGVALAADGSPGNVSVEFVHPEKFTDLQQGRFPDARDRDMFMADLRRFIEQRAASELGPDRKLDVTITDVDMAGEVEPVGFHRQDVRILRDSTPPKIDLAFRVTDSSGHVLKSGERHLSDLAYKEPVAGRSTDAPLYFEKKMLANWLSGELRN